MTLVKVINLELNFKLLYTNFRARGEIKKNRGYIYGRKQLDLTKMYNSELFHLRLQVFAMLVVQDPLLDDNLSVVGVPPRLKQLNCVGQELEIHHAFTN